MVAMQPNTPSFATKEAKYRDGRHAAGMFRPLISAGCARSKARARHTGMIGCHISELARSPRTPLATSLGEISLRL